jgi:hypothetical protein
VAVICHFCYNSAFIPEPRTVADGSFFEEGIERCSQNYEHPQRESESVAHTTHSTARTWRFVQIVAATGCRIVLVQAAATFAQVFK